MDLEYDRWLADPDKQARLWRAAQDQLNKALRSGEYDRGSKLSELSVTINAAVRAHEQKQPHLTIRPDIRPEMRCSLADRLNYQDRLATAFAEGRLSKEEWEIRHDLCANAVSVREMDALMRDIPRPSLPAQVPAAPPSRIKLDKSKWSLRLAFAVCFIGLTVVNIPEIPGSVQGVAALIAILTAIVTFGLSSRPKRKGSK